MRKNKRKTLCLLIISATLAFTGCEEKIQSEASDSIVLLEPVNAASNIEAAAYRNLYDYEVLSGTVYPQLKEYSFEGSILFSEYTAILGDSVKKGDTLASADDTSIKQQIEDLKDLISYTNTEYENKQTSNQSAIKEKEQQKAELVTEKNKLENEWNKVQNDENDLSEADEKKDQLQVSIQGLTDQIRVLQRSIDNLNLNINQAKELYKLDTTYYEQKKERLLKKKNDLSLYADISGQVVAVGEYMSDAKIDAATSLTAVADKTKKIIKCEYINKAKLEKANEFYAFVNGKHYKITYQPMDAQEYTRLVNQGQEVYSTFVLNDPNNEIQIGDFVVIPVIFSYKEQVLTIPKSSLHKDASGTFVYQVKEGESVYTKVETGMSDGVYTEVKSGINVGDQVMLNVSQSPKTGETVKASISTFSNDFEGEGYMSYPISSSVTNTITYGITYFTKFQVSLYQHVNKGDVIATISVKADNIALYEKQLSLKRQQERLIEARNDKNQTLVKQYTKTISELKETIAKMQQDFATTKIVASSSGIIIGLADYKEDTIIYPEMFIAQIADESDCFVSVENAKHLLNYGNKVEVSYTNQNNENCTAQGEVVNVSAPALSAELQTDNAYIKLPPEVIAEMSATTVSNHGDRINRSKFKITAKTRGMNNIVVVPKEAVTEINGKTYVYILEQGNEIKAQSFIAGGYDASNYWVIEGVEEGTNLCLK